MHASSPVHAAARRLRDFADDDSGATLVEYGLLVAFVAVGALAAFTALGGSVTGLFGSTGAADTMDTAAATASAG